MTIPKISVVLPTYSRRRILPRTIASVLAQDEKEFELIIIDDCSVDDTPAYLASLNDPRIRVLKPANNLGTAGARNLGLEVARADIVALLDDDDAYLDHRLSATLAVFAREPEVVATLSSSVKFDLKRTQIALMPELTLAPAAFEWALICDLIGVEGTSITVRRQTALDVGGFCHGMKWIDAANFSSVLLGMEVVISLQKRYGRNTGQTMANPINGSRPGLSLLSYVAAQPDFAGRYRKVGSYLATKILVSDLRHGLISRARARSPRF